MAPKSKAGAKAGAKTRAKRGTKEHENALQRVRYHVARSKKSIRKEYAKASRAEKAEWAKKWAETQNFDWVVCRKTKHRSKVARDGKEFEWLTEDGLLTAEGWTEENQNTPFGLRAHARAQAVVTSCKKLKGFTRVDSQHGDVLYKKILVKGAEVNESGEMVSTSLYKKSSMADAEAATSSSSSGSSSSSDDDDDDDTTSNDEPMAELEDTAGSKRCECLMGKSASLMAKMSTWDASSMVFLKPWEPKLKEVLENLAKGQGSLTKIMASEGDIAKHKKTLNEVEKFVHDGEALYDLIQPILSSVLAANATINRAGSSADK